jgi:hypothetical protein
LGSSVCLRRICVYSYLLLKYPIPKAAMGAMFAFTESVVANERETDDAWNGAAGGCAAGFLAGIRGYLNIDRAFAWPIDFICAARSLPVAIASCAIVGGAVGAFDYAGHLSGDLSETKEERRRKFFKNPPKSLVQPPSE